MKTTTQLRKLVESAGGILEEDEGRRDMRCFQACAPDGKIWGEGVTCLRIDWAAGTSPHAIAFNEDAFKDLTSRLSSGLRDQTEGEKYLCSED